MAKLELSEWSVELLRASLFVWTAPTVTAQDWWTQVVGNEPEQVQIKRGEASSEASGPFEGNGKLTLRVTTTRIDWTVRPAVPAPGAVPDSAGELDQLTRSLRERLGAFFKLESRPRLHRIAVGTVVAHPEDSVESGNKLLSEYIGHRVQISQELDSELFYQVNRRRKSKVSTDISFNRLSKWSVVELHSVQLSAQGLSEQNRSTVTRIELDVNTAPLQPGELLPDDKDLALLDEAADLSLGLLSGDLD